MTAAPNPTIPDKIPDDAQTAHTRRAYDRHARFYDALEWPVEQLLYRRWRKALWQRIEGPEVIEVGVGTGKNVPYYPEGVQVTAVDLSEGMLERARRVLARHPAKAAALYRMDAEHLDFADDTFDEAVATFVFCSVPDPVVGLREVLRVTRPGGHLRLIEHQRADAEALGRVMDRLDGPIHRRTGVHIARRTVGNVRAAGWHLDHARHLTPLGLFRRIDAHKPL
jgi:ubiquinone/menaquinone biosynthesis C-methylase UbiE